jgi:hypothetical protein
VELYMYCSSGPSWPVLGRALPYVLHPRKLCICRNFIELRVRLDICLNKSYGGIYRHGFLDVLYMRGMEALL